MKKTNFIIVIGLLIVGCSFLLAYKNIGVSENNKEKDKKRMDISDLVLIYYGYGTVWNVNELRPYVYTEGETGFHWLFDGFLFLVDKIRDKGYTFYYSGSGEYKTAAKNQWEWLLDLYFGKDRGPDALEAILDSLSRKGKTPFRARRVVIGIPWPVREFTGWGELDGKNLDFNKAEDRIAATRWFIDKTLDKWRKKKYKHIQLEGFYWTYENAGKDNEIIPGVKEYLKKKDMKLYWIPYWKAVRAEQWSSVGFDFAYQQPNYFFSTKIPYQRLDDACHFAEQNGLGMEMEFDKNVTKPEFRSRYYDYIKSYEANGVWANRQVAYYQGGGGAWLQMSKSNEPEMKMMVETLSSIIIGRQEKKDKNGMKK